ncbi:MAG: response regulator transcription factor [Actinomycetota bacterium]|nr:response regulator transcription factor [Actinomycetota bacterium]MDI7251966.1 response regulator transcription factor [Actinomycetota bacterium]
MEKEASLSLSGGHEAESDTEHDTGTIGIVVVDDHESVRSSIARIVSLQEDMTLLGEASNGRAALEVVERTRPDLVLVDIRMPEMDGLELIRVLRGNYPGLRIVALSAHEEELYVSEALKHGADTYVLKGVPLKDLVGTIRRVMWGRIDLPSEVTEPLISSFRLADSVLGMLGQAFAAFYRGEEALDFLASCAAELCGGELYALAFRNGDAFGMETGKLRKERRPPICEAEGWSLSERDLFELVALVDGRHPVVCNEHRLRNRARGWRSPYIHLVINPVFLGDGLEALMLIAGSRPFHLSPPLVRYLGLLSDQAAVFLDLLGLRREKSRLEEANGRLRDLLRYVAGEAAGGANLRRMLEILVESLGLRSGTLFGRSEGGRWRVVCKYGLSEEEAAALAKVIAGSTAYVDPPRTPVSPSGTRRWQWQETEDDGSTLLVLPVDPDAPEREGEREEGFLHLDGGSSRAWPPFPPFLLALVLPEDFSPEEEADVLQGFAACMGSLLKGLSEETW